MLANEEYEGLKDLVQKRRHICENENWLCAVQHINSQSNLWKILINSSLMENKFT